MKDILATKKLNIGGMTCISCQNLIEGTLLDTPGIKKVSVSWAKGTADVTYKSDTISSEEISKIIGGLGYDILGDKKPSRSAALKGAGILVIVIAIYMLLQYFGFARLFNSFPVAEAGMSYGMLFVIGLLTSVHCVAMCGGINITQTLPARGLGAGRFGAMRPSFLYNLGRVLSYTLIGALAGALGSVVSLSGGLKGAVQLGAGIFMVIMGINMLGVFPQLRKLNLRMPKFIARVIYAEKAGSNSPLYVGLLNGLMPCGPLQAMQLYALSTGDPLKGAVSMFVFSLGTTPLMFGLGALSSILSKKFTRKVLTIGAALVIVLGLSMFSNGWSLSGMRPLPFLGTTSGIAGEARAVVRDGSQEVHTTLESGSYPTITVKAGVPVRWVMDAPDGTINGCNNRMQIPAYDFEYRFKPGENVLEFTPTKAGEISYSCWMGMIKGTIHVLEPSTF